MGLGFGIALIVVGAVMKWGLTVDRTQNFNLDTIGTILFVIGLLGTLASLVLWTDWGFPRTRRRSVTYDRQGAAGTPAVTPAAAPYAVPGAPAAGVPVAGAPVAGVRYVQGVPYAPGVPVAGADYYAAPAPQHEVIEEEIRDSRL